VARRGVSPQRSTLPIPRLRGPGSYSGSAPGATQLESAQRGQILLDQRVALLHAGVAAQRIGGRVIRLGQQSSRFLDFEPLIRRHFTKLLHRP